MLLKILSRITKPREGFSRSLFIVEPEILIVDEVLALEDVAFQEKSFLKIKEMANAGRTVLFVSPNMRVIANLCDRALLLSKGQIILQANTDKVISHYLAKNRQ